MILDMDNDWRRLLVYRAKRRCSGCSTGEVGTGCTDSFLLVVGFYLHVSYFLARLVVPVWYCVENMMVMYNCVAMECYALCFTCGCDIKPRCSHIFDKL
jgi:hypothetical protein